MKLPYIALVAFTVSISSAQSLLDGFPACGTSCLAEALVTTGCNATDLACLCANEQFWGASAQCVVMACPTRDVLTTEARAKTNCHIQPRNDSIIVTVLVPVFYALATLFLLLRIIARSPRRFELAGWDDLTILVAWVASTPVAVIDQVLVYHGLGKDLWAVPFDQVISMLFWYWTVELFYLQSTMLMKISILLFYLRIFPGRTFKRRVYVLLAYCVASGLIFTFVSAFQCTPVSHAWHSLDRSNPGHCINLAAGAIAAATSGILLDLAVLLLPLPQLLALQMSYSWKTKAQIFIMFSIGLLVTVVSAIRLKSLLGLTTSTNITYDFLPTAYWSAIEMYVGICCACLPSVRIFVSRLLPQWLGISQSTLEPTKRTTPSAKVSVSWKMQSGTASRATQNDDASDAYPLTDRESASLKDRTTVGHVPSDRDIVRTDSYHVFAKEMNNDEEDPNDPYRCARNTETYRRRMSTENTTQHVQ